MRERFRKPDNLFISSEDSHT